MASSFWFCIGNYGITKYLKPSPIITYSSTEYKILYCIVYYHILDSMFCIYCTVYSAGLSTVMLSYAIVWNRSLGLTSHYMIFLYCCRSIIFSNLWFNFLWDSPLLYQTVRFSMDRQNVQYDTWCLLGVIPQVIAPFLVLTCWLQGCLLTQEPLIRIPDSMVSQ